jgi:hypothetical protein
VTNLGIDQTVDGPRPGPRADSVHLRRRGGRLRPALGVNQPGLSSPSEWLLSRSQLYKAPHCTARSAIYDLRGSRCHLALADANGEGATNLSATALE